MTLTCDHCSANCCKYIALEIEKPKVKKDWDNIFWYLHHENVLVYIDQDNDWILEFRTPCKNLQEDNGCGIYETRPLVCRNHIQKTCEFHNSESPYKQEFTCAEDLKKYLEQKNINYKFGEFKK